MSQVLVPVRLFTDETVDTTNTVTSAAVDLTRASVASLVLEMTSTGDAHDLAIAMTVAETPDGAYTEATDHVTLTSSTATEFPNSATYAIAMSLPTALGTAVKFTFTGVGANPADTSLTATLLLTEDQ